MTKKERNERKKRIKSLVLLLFLTIILLTTSTYAWFTANRSVQIDPIDVHIAASSGLQISSDASVWKTVITNQDIVTGYTNHKNMLPGELTPVSTAGIVTTSGQTAGQLQFFKGVVEGDSNNGGAMSLTATATPAEAQYVPTINNGVRTYPTLGDGEEAPLFIAFDVFFKVDAAGGGDIFLENGSGVTVTTNQQDKGLQYAARYAFVLEGNETDVTTSAGTMQGKWLGTSSTVVEPNFDAHTATGVSAASTYYGISITQAASGQPAVNYVGVKAAIPSPIILPNTNPGGSGTVNATYFQAVSDLRKTNVAYSAAGAGRVAYNGSTAADNLLMIFHLNQGITKVRVYMWIEGQDVDCENSASGAYLTYKLGFTLDDEE